MVDVGLICYNTNLVALKKVQPSTSLGVSLFEGYLKLVDKVDRIVGGNIKIVIKLVEPSCTMGNESDTDTLTPSSTTKLPLFSWVLCIEVVSRDFLQ